MFRKPLITISSHQLKGSESKKLKQKLQTSFPLIGTEQIAKIWPSSATLSMRKLDGRIFVYFIKDTPIFYTCGKPAEDKGQQLEPTLYLLHAAPQLIGCVDIHVGVGAHLIKGAELFMPGLVISEVPPGQSWVIDNFGKFGKFDQRAITEQGNCLAVAIARWSVSYDELEYRGRTGKAFDVVHHIGDEMWKLGSEKTINAETAKDMADSALLQHEEQRLREKKTAEEMEKQELAAKAFVEKQAFIATAPKQIKKLQKQLRQILEIREKVETGVITHLEKEQQEKLDKHESVATEMAQIQQQLEAYLNPPTLRAEEGWATTTPLEEEIPDDWSNRGVDIDTACDNATNFDTNTNTNNTTTDTDTNTNTDNINNNNTDVNNNTNNNNSNTDNTNATDDDGSENLSNDTLRGTTTTTNNNDDANNDADDNDSNNANINNNNTESTSGRNVVDGEVATEVLTGDQEKEKEAEVPMEEVLMSAFLLALHTSVTTSDLPMLTSTFYSKHVLPSSRLTTLPKLNIKQTRYKKFNVFLDETHIHTHSLTRTHTHTHPQVSRTGLIGLKNIKAGVDHLVSINRSHTTFLSFDPDSVELAEVVEDEDAVETGVHQIWKGQTPKKGSQKIEINLKKVRGNKNLTVITNLQNFGLKLDESFRSNIAKHFSVAVTYSDGPDVTKGKLVNVQGKFVVQLANYLIEKNKIPQKHIAADTKGVSKKDKKINV